MSIDNSPSLACRRQIIYLFFLQLMGERRLSVMSRLDLFKKIEKSTISPRASSENMSQYPTIHTKTAQELLELLEELDQSGKLI